MFLFVESLDIFVIPANLFRAWKFLMKLRRENNYCSEIILWNWFLPYFWAEMKFTFTCARTSAARWSRISFCHKKDLCFHFKKLKFFIFFYFSCHNKLEPLQQSTQRENHSTETAFLRAANMDLYMNCISLLSLLDLSAALDTLYTLTSMSGAFLFILFSLTLFLAGSGCTKLTAAPRLWLL